MSTPALVRVAAREALVFRRLWRGVVVSALVTPLLFLGAIGLGLGGLVDERAGRVHGLDYLVFVTPGLLAATAVQLAAGESLWPVMGGTKWFRTYHAMVVTPLRPSDVLGGHLLWTAARSTLAGAAFLAVAALLGGVPAAWGVLALPAAVAGALAVAAPLSAYAARQDTDVTFPAIMRMGVLPLFLFSGTVFPVEELPAVLERLVVLSPLWHAVELCRAATTGTVAWASAAGHAAVLVVWAAAGWWWGARTFTRRLAP